MQAKGTFEIEMTGETPYSTQDGVTLARAAFTKQSTGDLVGDSTRTGSNFSVKPRWIAAAPSHSRCSSPPSPARSIRRRPAMDVAYRGDRTRVLRPALLRQVAPHLLVDLWNRGNSDRLNEGVPPA